MEDAETLVTLMDFGFDLLNAIPLRLLVFVEQLDVVGPGEGVGGEEHREDEHLGEDEDPDGEVAGKATAGLDGGGQGIDGISHGRHRKCGEGAKTLIWPK